jgi:hypothetical protein
MDMEIEAPVDDLEAIDAVDDDEIVAYGRGPTNDVLLCS